MKKTASKILLSTMALATCVSGVGAGFTQGNSAWAAESDIVTSDLEELKSFVKFEYIDPANSIRLSFAKRPLEFKFVYFDYENGVTESEADELLPTLGQGDDDWYITIDQSSSPSLWHTLAPKSPAKLDDNKSELVYFALRYGTKVAGTDEVQNEYWVRGKLDYRSCYNSEAYRDGMFCRPLVDSATGETAFLLTSAKDSTEVLSPEGEKIISWEEEWRQILKLRSDTMLAILRQFDAEFPSVNQTILEQFEADARKLSEVALKTPDTSRVLSQGRTIIELILSVRAKFSNSIGQNYYEKYQQLQEDYQALLDNVGDTDQDADTLRETIIQKEKEIAQLKTVIETQKTELEKSNTALVQKQDKITELEAKLVVLQDLQAKLEELEQENQTLRQRVKELEAELNAAKAELSGKEDGSEIKIWQEKFDKATVELQSVQKALVEAEAKLQAVQTVKEGLTSEVEKVTEENTRLKQENATLTSEKQALEQENAMLKERVKTLEAELAQARAQSVGEVRVNDDTIEVSVTETAEVNDEVEVPNLGEIDTQTNWWWIVAGVVAALGALGLWCKRHFGRR